MQGYIVSLPLPPELLPPASFVHGMRIFRMAQ